MRKGQGARSEPLTAPMVCSRLRWAFFLAAAVLAGPILGFPENDQDGGRIPNLELLTENVGASVGKDHTNHVDQADHPTHGQPDGINPPPAIEAPALLDETDPAQAQNISDSETSWITHAEPDELFVDQSALALPSIYGDSEDGTRKFKRSAVSRQYAKVLKSLMAKRAAAAQTPNVEAAPSSDDDEQDFDEDAVEDEATSVNPKNNALDEDDAAVDDDSTLMELLRSLLAEDNNNQGRASGTQDETAEAANGKGVKFIFSEGGAQDSAGFISSSKSQGATGRHAAVDLLAEKTSSSSSSSSKRPPKYDGHRSQTLASEASEEEDEFEDEDEDEENNVPAAVNKHGGRVFLDASGELEKEEDDDSSVSDNAAVAAPAGAAPISAADIVKEVLRTLASSTSAATGNVAAESGAKKLSRADVRHGPTEMTGSSGNKYASKVGKYVSATKHKENKRKDRKNRKYRKRKYNKYKTGENKKRPQVVTVAFTPGKETITVAGRSSRLDETAAKAEDKAVSAVSDLMNAETEQDLFKALDGLDLTEAEFGQLMAELMSGDEEAAVGKSPSPVAAAAAGSDASGGSSSSSAAGRAYSAVGADLKEEKEAVSKKADSSHEPSDAEIEDLLLKWLTENKLKAAAAGNKNADASTSQHQDNRAGRSSSPGSSSLSPASSDSDVKAGETDGKARATKDHLEIGDIPLDSSPDALAAWVANFAMTGETKDTKSSAATKRSAPRGFSGLPRPVGRHRGPASPSPASSKGVKERSTSESVAGDNKSGASMVSGRSGYMMSAQAEEIEYTPKTYGERRTRPLTPTDLCNYFSIGCGCKGRVSTNGPGLRDRSRVCDGYSDCPGGDDETGCFITNLNGVPIISDAQCAGQDCVQCQPMNWYCTIPGVRGNPDTECFSMQNVCDGVTDCPKSGKDENNCFKLDDYRGPKSDLVPRLMEGFLYRMINGRWHLVCESPWSPVDDQVRQLCITVTGRNIPADTKPTVTRIHPRHGGPYGAGNYGHRGAPPSYASYARFEYGTWKVLSQCETSLYRVTCPQLACGAVSTPPALGPNRVPPDEAPERVHPWTVSILRDTVHHGEGTILTSRWIATAAQVFIDSSAAERRPDIVVRAHTFQAQAGTLRLNSAPAMQQIRDIVNVNVHEAYSGLREASERTRLNDIALAMVDEPFHFNAHVNCIALPSADAPDVAQGTQCTTASWGFHARREPPGSDALRALTIDVSRRCDQIDRARENPELLFCGLSLFPNPPPTAALQNQCLGTSGGALVCIINNVATFTGIVSHGPDDCPPLNGLTVFTRIRGFLQWIQGVIRRPYAANYAPRYGSRPRVCNSLRCNDRRCILRERQCDGIFQCPANGEDEIEGCASPISRVYR